MDMNIRYYCEHIAFRDMFSNDPIKVISKLVTEKEEFIYDLFLKIYDQKNEAFPYQSKDCKVEIKSKDLFEYAIITLPESFMAPTLCYKIILAYSFQLDLFQYFTIEDANDEKYGEYKVLCGWIEKNHYVFMNFKDGEDENIEDKIYDTIMVG